LTPENGSVSLRESNLVQVQLVDKAVAGLPGQVPQQHLTRLAAPARRLHLLGAERPDVAAVR
jgi:hypothetical protein